MQKAANVIIGGLIGRKLCAASLVYLWERMVLSMQRKVCLLVLFLFLLGSVCSAASVVRHPSSPVPGTRAAEVSYLVKHTSFTRDEIRGFYDEGLNKENIKELYILKDLSDRNQDEVIASIKENDNLDMVLKDLQVDPEKYEKAYERAFPPGEETNSDRVRNIKNLRHKKIGSD